MKRIKIAQQILAGLLAVIMTFMAASVTAFADRIPSPTSTVAKENVLALLKKYNSDVYHIMNTMNEKGEDLTRWWDSDKKLIEKLDTAVHETYHSYTHRTSPSFNGDNIYLGNGNGYLVDFEGVDLFKTCETTAALSEKMKTFRFDLYVSEASGNSSNVNGVRGLINEFSAYYWGLNTMSSLVDYYKLYDTDNSGWEAYVTSLGNNMNAYAEFKFWILNYMIYAQKNHPDIYKAILENAGFCNAYTATETRFSALIDYNANRLESINKYLSDKNHFIRLTDTYVRFCNLHRQFGVELDDYKKLTDEMSKSKYVQMDGVIKSNADKSANYNNISAPALQSVQKGSSGIKVTWNISNNADGYYIYRSENDGKYKKVKTIKKGNTAAWTDKTATQSGVEYRYKIRAYNTTGNSKLSKAKGA